jgi:phosphate transport system substrate-binding protein
MNDALRGPSRRPRHRACYRGGHFLGESSDMSPIRFLAALLVLVPLAAFAAPRHAAALDELTWRGDHATARAMMDDLAREYAKEKKGRISLQPFSTVSGLDAVASGSADMGGSARGKYDRRPAEAGINFVPVALDAAVLITHPRNPVRGVTLRQMHDIYYGRITNWKELGGEDKPINLYAIAAPLDGVEFSSRELVFANGDQRVAAPRLYLNTTKLEEAIAIDPAGLGLSTLAGVAGNKGVKTLEIEGTAASPATVANGSYPLYITLYLTDRVGSPRQAAIDQFLAFVATPAAKEILRRHSLVPVADVPDLEAHAKARLAFLDAHLDRGGAPATALAAATPAPTPVSAPRATLEARTRIAPTAESTQAARENLARAEEKKAAERAAAAQPPAAAKPKVLAKADPPAAAAKKPAPAHKVARAPAAKPAKKKAVAKAEPKAAAPAKPVSFGNVSGGATGTSN